MSKTITYETSSDGFGDNATDADRDSFFDLVKRRVEETYPGYTCEASCPVDALDSHVYVDSDDPEAPDADELCSWIGNDLWNEWCAETPGGAS